ncbi:MAG: hypothetical protein M1832_003448 [Thelocarpon impressellum]|nr:MAG: hypothetical protein M1832_003448 [Thelocarpon impressellum]
MPTPSPLSAPLSALLTTYHDLNASQCAAFSAAPTPLEFMRHVALNRPFVVRGGAGEWPALRRWDEAYLRAKIGARSVEVAVTPDGRADAVVHDAPCGGGAPIFAKPLETRMPFVALLAAVRAQESRTTPASPVYYAQTQNNNLPSEYAPLAPDVPVSIAFADEALQRAPDAANFWLGGSRSVTALHRDGYENLYACVVGRKRFVLLPPVAVACVRERDVRGGRYAWADGSESELELRLDDDGGTIPFPTWDPDEPGVRSGLADLSRPMEVWLEAGDLLYLPALWYDMDYGGGFHAMASFVRDVGNLADAGRGSRKEGEGAEGLEGEAT